MGPALAGLLGAMSMLGLFVVIWWRDAPRIEKARALLEKGATLVDVDDPAQFARAHLEGAKNIPLEELARRASEIGPPEQPVVVYGRGNMRAARGASTLRALGFQEVMNVGRGHL